MWYGLGALFETSLHLQAIPLEHKTGGHIMRLLWRTGAPFSLDGLCAPDKHRLQACTVVVWLALLFSGEMRHAPHDVALKAASAMVASSRIVELRAHMHLPRTLVSHAKQGRGKSSSHIEARA